MSPQAQLVSRDLVGLRAALAELYRNGDRAQLPRPHGRWLSHLFWLQRIVAQDPAAAHECTYDELRGLDLLHDAQQKHQAAATRCPHPDCGALTPKGLSCRACGRALKPLEAK